jgi:hypothetical protein
MAQGSNMAQELSDIDNIIAKYPNVLALITLVLRKQPTDVYIGELLPGELEAAETVLEVMSFGSIVKFIERERVDAPVPPGCEAVHDLLLHMGMV